VGNVVVQTNWTCLKRTKDCALLEQDSRAKLLKSVCPILIVRLTVKLLPITGKTIPEKCDCLPGYKGDGAGFCKAFSATDQDYSKRTRPAQSP